MNSMNSKYNLRHKKSTRLKWYFIAGALALSSSLPMAQAGPEELKGPPEWLKELPNDKSQRVIVQLSSLRETRRTESPFQALVGVGIKQSQNAFFTSLAEDLEEKGIKDPVLLGSSIKVFDTVNAVVLEGTKTTLLAISNNPLVESMQKDRLSRVELSDSVPLIEADSAWDMGYSGAGQAVVILDSGVDKTHPDLAGKVVSEACYSTTSLSYSSSSLCPNKADEQIGSGAGVACGSDISGCSHGTHVAGIAAANGGVLGVAKDAKIIAIQVFSSFDDPNFCGGSDKTPCALSWESDQIAALERVWQLHEDDTNIAAVNMSLGSEKHLDVCNGLIQNVIDRLRSAGIATIAASGNSGYTDGIASPACISSAISVGATTKDDEVASYSNSADILDLLAPGSFIISTRAGGGIAMKSGTSMATPHVTGAFAALKSAAPDASVDEILIALKRTGTRITDSRNGIIKPRINLKKALERLAPTTPPPTLVPDISVAPNSYNFRDVTVGESSRVKILRISNTGDGGLEIGKISLSSGDFSINKDDCSNTTVSAGGTCTVRVTFAPQTEGAKNATLSIPSNDPDTATATVTLRGNGIIIVPLVPDISVTPTSIDFGDVTVGEPSTRKILTISNTGDDDLEIGKISLGNRHFSIKRDTCSNTTVSAGGTCIVKVIFAPQTAGVKKARLSIPSNDPDTATATVTLLGNGIAPLIPDISVTPTSFDFGDVTVGESSSVKTLTVSNTGNGNLDIGQISLEGEYFSISTNNCSNTTVSAGGTCVVKVIFAPQTEGAKNATLSIPSNDPDTATATVTLLGNGIAPLIPDISVTPTSFDFGDVTLGESSTMEVIVSSTGNGNLDIGQISLEGEYFSISTNNCSKMTVAPGGTCTVEITFAPQTEGAKNATLSIPSNASDTFTVTVQGEGIRVQMPTDTPTPASCQLYAVNDKGLNNSQFFTISLPDLKNVSKLGEMCDGCDIESLTIKPDTNIIYAASGDDATNGKKGHLYTVDGETGELTSVGSTGFNEIEGLAFSADGNTLRAWAKGDGFITVDIMTGMGTLVKAMPDALVEDIVLSGDTDIFYGAIGTELWMYDVPADELKMLCSNLPGETEALERLPDGSVLIGTDKNKTLSLHVFDPTTCQVLATGDILVDPFDDVEGLALPIGCLQ